jgi:hypothetical protein
MRWKAEWIVRIIINPWLIDDGTKIPTPVTGDEINFFSNVWVCLPTLSCTVKNLT